MLFGEHRPTIDAQYRFSVPAKFRVALGEEFMIVRNLKQDCLSIYSMSAWEEYVAFLKKNLPQGKLANAMRKLHGQAVLATPDSLGRVRVPREIWESIGVGFDETGDSSIIVVGCGDFGEIWLQSNYDAYMNSIDLDALAEEIEGCML